MAKEMNSTERLVIGNP